MQRIPQQKILFLELLVLRHVYRMSLEPVVRFYHEGSDSHQGQSCERVTRVEPTKASSQGASASFFIIHHDRAIWVGA